MEDGGEAAQGIGTRLHHLTHHIDLDGTGIAQGQTDFQIAFGTVETAVRLAQHLLEVIIGRAHGHAAQGNGADLLDIDGSVGRNLLTDGILAGSPDVDDHLIARAEPVVGRSSQIDTGFKCQVAGIEDVASEDLVLAGKFSSIGLRSFQRCGSVLLHRLAQAGFIQFGTAHLRGIDSLLLFVQFLYSFGLFACDASPRQFSSQLTLVLPFGHPLFHVLQYLLVAHGLCTDRGSSKEQTQKQRNYQ